MCIQHVEQHLHLVMYHLLAAVTSEILFYVSTYIMHASAVTHTCSSFVLILPYTEY